MKAFAFGIGFLSVGAVMGGYFTATMYVRNHAFDWIKGYQVGLAYEQDRQTRLVNLGGLCTYSAIACPEPKGK